MSKYISELYTMLTRSLKHISRSIDTIITVILQPVFLMLLFVYVFGGALSEGMTRSEYIAYSLPGIFIIGIGSSVAYTALNINTDLSSGIFQRFYSMPISKSSVLGSHIITSIVSCSISLIGIFLVALLIGFKSSASLLDWLIIIIILLLFMLAITMIAVFSGVASKSPEAASIFSYPIIFLPLISSAFVSTDSMSAPIRYFAEHQPVTYIVDSIRNIYLNEPIGKEIYYAMAWIIALIVIFYLLSLMSF